MTQRFYAGGHAQVRALEAWRIASVGAAAFFTLTLEQIHTRQRGLCYLCAVGFVRGPRFREPLGYSKEHVFPRGHGGGREGNLLLAHRSCNTAKDNRWPFPCEVIYLAAVYSPPHDAVMARAAKVAERKRRRAARLAAIFRFR